MPITYIKDKKRKRKAVQIPIEEWESLIREFRKLDDYRKMRTDLAEALTEIREYESGKKKPRTLKQFLNAL